MKQCYKCKEEKDFIFFHKNKTKEDGYNYLCKLCVKEKYELNKEKILKRKKIYVSENKEKIFIKNKEYCLINKDKKKEYYKKYYIKNKNKITKTRKTYVDNNKEEIVRKKKEYYKKNKEYFYKKSYAYNKKMYKEDDFFRFKINVRSLISGSFKRSKVNFKKTSKTEEILGCSLDNFKLFISSQFTKGMSFENHGKWHIDHVIPISTAKNKEEVIKLNHYTNFQPLWAKDNLYKKNKIIEKQLKLI